MLTRLADGQPVPLTELRAFATDATGRAEVEMLLTWIYQGGAVDVVDC